MSSKSSMKRGPRGRAPAVSFGRLIVGCAVVSLLASAVGQAPVVAQDADAVRVKKATYPIYNRSKALSAERAHWVNADRLRHLASDPAQPQKGGLIRRAAGPSAFASGTAADGAIAGPVGNLCLDCEPTTVAAAGVIEASLDGSECAFAEAGLAGFYDVYEITLDEPRTVSATMSSDEFDTFLVLEDDCVLPFVIAFNDACGSGVPGDACVQGDLDVGTYYIMATSANGGETGNYSLDISIGEIMLCIDCEVGSVGPDEMGDGVLEEGDCTLPDGTLVDIWSVVIEEDGVYTFNMTGDGFDTFLFLYADTCIPFIANDDCFGDLTQSCITLPLMAGTYFGGVNGFSPADSGGYTFSVTRLGDFDCTDCRVGAIECGGSVEGSLAVDDCAFQDTGTIVDLYTFELANEGPVIIDLQSPDFDAMVNLHDTDCGIIDSNDDVSFPADLNSQLIVDLQPGSYVIAVTSSDFAPGQTGAYTLSVECPDARLCLGECSEGPVTCGEPTAGSLEAGDCTLDGGGLFDSYVLELAEPSRVSASIPTAGFAPTVSIFDRFCETVASSSDCGGADEACVEAVLAAGTYYVGVAAPSGASGAYELLAACEPVPDCVLCTLDPIACDESLAITFPIGQCVRDIGQGLDFYPIEVAETSTLTIDLTADYDGYLELYNANCQLVGFNDDRVPGDLNPLLEFAATPGLYYIGVSSFDVGQGGAGTLQVACDTNVDRPCEDCIVDFGPCGEGQELTATFPEDGVACTRTADGQIIQYYSVTLGEDGPVTIELAAVGFDPFLVLSDTLCNTLEFNDDCEAGNFTLSCLSIDDLPAGEYYVGVSSFDADEAGEFTLTLTGSCGPSNCDACQVGTIGPGGSVDGNLGTDGCPGDAGTSPVHSFLVELATPYDGTVEVSSTAFDTVLGIYSASCSLLQSNDDCPGGGGNSSCVDVSLAPGTYWVQVSGFESASSGAYNLTMTGSDGVGPFLRGDCNGDGLFAGQVTDAVYLLNFNFSGGPAPGCDAACDANADGSVFGAVTDAILMLNFNFLGGPPPAAPFPTCGTSSLPSDVLLGCDEPLACP